MLDCPFGGVTDKDIGDYTLAVGAHDNEITIQFLCGFNYNFGGCSVFD
jgi:hypothetical protein